MTSFKNKEVEVTETFGDIIKEYGMVYEPYLSQQGYVELFKEQVQKLMLYTKVNGLGYDKESDVQTAMWQMSTHGKLVINDSEKFVAKTAITYKKGKEYPGWFLQTMEILIRLEGKELAVVLFDDTTQMDQLLSEKISKTEEQDEFSLEVSGVHPLEFTFQFEQAFEKARKAFLRQQRRFGRKFLKNEEIKQMSARIEKVLRKEIEPIE